MILSQLPHVMANVDTTGGELSAASTLSTLLATAWTKYLARTEITEPELGAQTPYTVTGGHLQIVRFFGIFSKMSKNRPF
jgi:hypothetical protein